MEELIEDYPRVRQACVEIFEIRDTHAWPPALNAEPNWREVYPALAEEFAFPITDVDDAVPGVQAMVDRIDEAR